jgi:hypothetical protein
MVWVEPQAHQIRSCFGVLEAAEAVAYHEEQHLAGVEVVEVCTVQADLTFAVGQKTVEEEEGEELGQDEHRV